MARIAGLDGRALVRVGRGHRLSIFISSAVLATCTVVVVTAGVAASATAGGAPVDTFADHGTGRFDVGLAEGRVYDAAVDPSGRTVVLGFGRAVVPNTEPLPPLEIRVSAFDRTGRPDPTFGTDGRVVVARPDCVEARRLTVDGAGRILILVLCGGVHVWRLLRSGVFDDSFGVHGEVVVPSPVPSPQFGVKSLVSKADGTTVLVSSVGLLGLDGAGQPIASYGDGVQPPLADRRTLTGVAAGSDGSIYVADTWTQVYSTTLEIRRFGPDGKQIVAFGSGGVTSLAVSLDDFVSSRTMAVDGAGALALYNGYSTIAPGGQIIRRVLSDGTLDPQFNGVNGVRPCASAGGDPSLAVSRDGTQILAAVGFNPADPFDIGGAPDIPVTLTALTSAGAPDPTVGDDPARPGCMSTRLPGERLALAVPGDGGVGQFQLIGVAGRLASVPTVRPLDTRLRPLTAYGDGGVTRAVIGSGGSDHFTPGNATEDALGRLVIATDTGGTTAVLRLRPDGTPDPTFGSAGRLQLLDLWSPKGLVATTDGAMILLAVSAAGDTVMRLRADGSPDPNFGVRGRIDHLPGLGHLTSLLDNAGVLYVGGCAPCAAAGPPTLKDHGAVAAVDPASGSPLPPFSGGATVAAPGELIVRAMAAAGGRLFAVGQVPSTSSAPPDAMACFLLVDASPCGDLAAGPDTLGASYIVSSSIAASEDRLVVADSYTQSVLWVDLQGRIVERGEAPPDPPTNVDRHYYATSVTAAPDGSVAALGWASGGIGFLRSYRADGTLDRSFGDDGQRTVDLRPVATDFALGLVQRTDGSLAVIGGGVDLVVRVLRTTAPGPFPGLAIDDTTAKESSGLLTFTIHVTPASDTPGTFSLDLEPVTASVDDLGPNSTFGPRDVAVPAGQTEVRVSLAVKGDGVVEADETIAASIVTSYPAIIERAAAVGTIVNDNDFPKITTTSLPAGIVGQPYSFQMTATGGRAPYGWLESLWGNSTGASPLAPGMRFDRTTGVLSGTPTAAFEGTVTFFVLNNGDWAPWSSLMVQLNLSVTVVPVAATRYSPLTPTRILDTRAGSGQPGAGRILGPSETYSLQVAGAGGVPNSGVSAVVMNLTVVAGGDIASYSYLTAYPSGTALPAAANLLFKSRQLVSNLVTVAVGANGRVELANAYGHADVIADVQGWYGAGGADLYRTAGAVDAGSFRIYDTRPNSGHDGAGQPLTTASTRSINLRPQFPDDPTVAAAVLNVTVVGGPDVTPASYLTVSAGGTARPLAANVVFGARQATANLVVAPVGSDGTINVYNAVGHADVIIDFEGWYEPTQGDHFYPMGPARVLDTRPGSRQPGANTTLGPGGSYSTPVNGVGTIPATGADAFVINLTGIGGTDIPSLSYLTLSLTGVPRPPTSNLIVGPGQIVPNLAYVKAGSGAISVYNAYGHTDAVADVAGWFAP